MRASQWFAISFLFASSLWAAPRFGHAFTDGVVLQCEKPISVWGFGAHGDGELQVRFGKTTVAAKRSGDPSGRWQAVLPAMAPDKKPAVLELLAGGKVTAAVGDVLVGEVWLAAGQSNMAWQFRQVVERLPEAKVWLDASDRPQVRLCQVPFRVFAGKDGAVTAAAPPDLMQPTTWKAMTPESTAAFSAVAVVFAREVADRTDRPVGILLVAMGGKPIEGFIPREAFQRPEFLQQIVKLADAGEKEALKKLEGGYIVRNLEGHPGAIFDAAMRPLAGFEMRGFVWYQAESNAGRGEDPRGYRHKMAALASGWRSAWQDPLPLLFVQLPSYPPATGWIRVREEQRLAQAMIKRCAMAVTIDIPGDDIHPARKVPVGERLAHLAEATVYGVKPGKTTGPSYAGHVIDGARVIVKFNSIGGGLVAGKWEGKGPVLVEGAPLDHFELAGADGNWHAATAQIIGESVVVQSAAVPEPKAARYACATDPRAGHLLYNRDQLPASPFCSDLELLPWQDQK